MACTCPAPLEAVGIRVQFRYIGNFNILYNSISHNKCSSVRCDLVANEICNNINISENHFLNINLLLICLINSGLILLYSMLLQYNNYKNTYPVSNMH
jgi:uncharacterized membrane protein